MSKSSTSFRLSKVARASLKRLAIRSGLSETRVLEALISQANALEIVARWKPPLPTEVREPDSDPSSNPPQ